MKHGFTTAILCLFFTITALGQSSIVDKFQAYIDKLDGLEDEKVQLDNEFATKEASMVYLDMVDNIQSMVESSALDKRYTKRVNGFLTRTLMDVSEKNIASYRPLSKTLSHANQLIFFREDTSRLKAITLQKPKLSLKCIQLIADLPIAEEILRWGIKNNPRFTFKQSVFVKDQDYSKSIFTRMAIDHPRILKSYYNSNYPFPAVLDSIDNDTIHFLIDGINNFNRNNRLLAMGHFVLNGTLNTTQAYALSRDDLSYFNWLHLATGNAKYFAKQFVEDELHFLALKRARLMNELHDEPPAVRFKPVANLSPELIFYTCVYSEEEIFTSTFNGTYQVFMTKLDSAGITGIDLFRSMNNHRFQTFIKMLANFGKLEDFMSHLSDGEKNILLGDFVMKIEGPDALQRAVDVAGAIASIENIDILTVIEYNLKNAYNAAKEKNDKEREVLYGILCNLFLPKAVRYQQELETIAANYPTPPIEKLPNRSLRDIENRNIQIHYFYDDEDGTASFNTFIQTFTSRGWAVLDRETFVEIRSPKGSVFILANKWNHEEDGHRDMESYLVKKGWQPNVVVHRGHSYYANLTIEKITASAGLVVIGSCGGYHNLTDVLERAPTAHIISSKQIGTMTVNNPLLFGLAENISKGNDLNWPVFWQRLDNQISPNSYAQEKFNDYVPPHKNLGAIFIQAYRELMGKS